MRLKTFLFMIFFLIFFLFLTAGNDGIDLSNPFGKDINEKAKRLYKNESGYWEAEFDYGIIMIYIPAGEFFTGLTEKEREWSIRYYGKDIFNNFHNIGDLRKVYLDEYWIGKYEVTFEQYDRYCEDTGKKKPKGRWGRGKLPVNYIDWNAANAYCEWLSEKTGLEFRLPLEAEWEKAARGTEGLIFPWGNKFDKNNCNTYDPTLISARYFERPALVGKFPEGASPYGCFNMAGNVSEWCSDLYKYANLSRSNAPPDGFYRGLRGGSYRSLETHCGSSYSAFSHRSCRSGAIGFRLTMNHP